MPHPPASPAAAPQIDETGANAVTSARRLFMQLHAWTAAAPADFDDAVLAIQTLDRALRERRPDHPDPEASASTAEPHCEFVVYRDVTDPTGMAVLTLAEDPAAFITTARKALAAPPFDRLEPVPELTMFGRTYALGYEPDLDETLRFRPRRAALTPDWPWAVWYPLRRGGEFEQLPAEQRNAILREHGTIDMTYGRANLAHDIRLASHGLDRHDNDFTVALVGPELAPLSKLVQHMRSTQQTSLYLKSLGPFFVGHVAYQSPLPQTP